MNKRIKRTLIAILFLIFIAASAFGGYYLATDGKIPFLPSAAEPGTNSKDSAQENNQIKKRTYKLMESPSYNEYALEYFKIGNMMGNLQNGGLVAPTLSTVYQAIPQEGIYKFSQSSEEVSFLTIPSESGSVQDYRSLNLIEGKIIYIDSANQGLYAVNTNGSGRVKLAEGVNMCYVYDQSAYFTTGTGVYRVNVNGDALTTLFEQEGWEFTLTGLSNTRIYFSGKEGNTTHWLSVNLKKPEKDVLRFLEDTDGNEVVSAQYSDGWLYYLKNTSGGSDLYRKQIGTEDEIKLAEAVTQYVVDRNRVYFGRTEAGSFHVRELNTDSDKVKIVLSIPATDDNDLTCYVGGEYIYAVGTDRGAGKAVNGRTCLWTAANDVMYYNSADAAWKFTNG